MATQLSAIGRLGTGFNVDENGVVSVSGGGELSNLIINGDFSVAQRGTSFTSETWRKNNDDSYLLDRWLLLSDGNDIVDVTQISSAFSRSRYALQAEVETANKKFGFCQIIEANSCIPLRGQKISVSFAAKTVSAKLIENVRVAVLEWTGTADQVTSDVVSAWNAEGSNPTWATSWAALNTPANLALTTSEQTFKVENLTVGASCNNLAVFIWVDDTDAAVDDILQLGEVQLVRGAIVPEFVPNNFDYELSRSKRRAIVIGGSGTNKFICPGLGIRAYQNQVYVNLSLNLASKPTLYTSGPTLETAAQALNNEVDLYNMSSPGFITISGAFTIDLEPLSTNPSSACLRFVAGTSLSGSPGDLVQIRFGETACICFEAEL